MPPRGLHARSRPQNHVIPNRREAAVRNLLLVGRNRDVAHRPATESPLLAFYACNAYNKCMQYTIRNVPDTLDEALRRAARERGKSLNEVAIEALARGVGITGESRRQRDLSDIAGTWREDPAFDNALAAQDTIDHDFIKKEMWK
jgi:plasmid stability protein